jgi:hypothetical protein
MIFSNSESRRFANGYFDRARRLPPDASADAAYFRDYCARLLEEMRAEQSRSAVAA